MNEDLHNLDNLFKKALEEHNELPSSTVWDNIDKSLDKNKVVSISKKYNKLKWAAAVLLLFSFGMAMYTLHIRTKNNELLSQNNAEKNINNQKIQTKINGEDSLNLTEKNNPAFEKSVTNEELKKLDSNNYTPSNIAPNNTDSQENKTIADNTKQGNVHAQLQFPSKGKTDERAPQKNQTHLAPINQAAININKQSAKIDSTNNKIENPVESNVADNDNNNAPANEEQQEKLPRNIVSPKENNNVISPKEKYVNGVPVISGLRDMNQMLVINPVVPIPNAIANNNEASKYNKNILLKLSKLKKGNSNSLSAIVFFSPDIVTVDTKKDHPRFREDDRNEIEKEEKIKSSTTLGVLIDLNAGKNWKLESGLTLSTMITDIQPKTIYARPDDNGNINYRYNSSVGYSFLNVKTAVLPVSGDSIKALSSKNTLQYIGVPLVVKYMFNLGRFSLTPGIGISANFLTKGKIQTTVETRTGDENAASNVIYGLKSNYFNGLASVSAQYKLNKNISVAFTPTARFALSSINTNAPVKTNLNSFGLVAGVIFKL
jgi:hypothetical protein